MIPIVGICLPHRDDAIRLRERRRLPLATLDQRLGAAGRAAGVEVLGIN